MQLFFTYFVALACLIIINKFLLLSLLTSLFSITASCSEYLIILWLFKCIIYIILSCFYLAHSLALIIMSLLAVLFDISAFITSLVASALLNNH